MKKIIALLATLIMALGCVFGLVGCNKDKDGVKIGSQSATTGYMYANYLKGVKAVAYDTHALAATDMKNGKVKYVICDGKTADSIVSTLGGIKKIDIPLTTEQYAIGVDPNQSSLLTSINGILETYKSEIDAILAKTENEFVAVTSEEYNSNNAAGQLVVATNAEFAPWEYVEGGAYKGYDMEIAKFIADKLSLQLVIQDMAFESVVSAVGNNNVDIVMAGLTVTADRKNSINFTKPYFEEAQYVLCLSSNTALDECGTVVDVLSVITK